MSNLRDFFTVVPAEQELSISLESVIEQIDEHYGNVELRQELSALIPTMESLYDAGGVIVAHGQPTDQDNYNRVIHGALAPHGIDFDNTNLTESMEGLKEMIEKAKKFFGMDQDSKDAKKVVNLLKANIKELKATYGNKPWLEKRERIDAEVSGSGIAPFLTHNGEFKEVSDVIDSALKVENRYIEQFKAAVETYHKELKPLAEKFLTNGTNFKDNFKAIVDDVEKLPLLGERIKLDFGNPPSGVKFGTVKDKVFGPTPSVKLAEQSSDKIRTLTVTQALELVRLVEKLLNFDLDHEDALVFMEKYGFFSAEDYPKDWDKDEAEVIFSKYMPWVFTKEAWGPSGSLFDGVYAFNRVRMTMYKATLTWLVRSFK